MRFKVITGCWEGSANSLYFVVDSRPFLQPSTVVKWYDDKSKASRLANKLNNNRRYKENTNG